MLHARTLTVLLAVLLGACNTQRVVTCRPDEAFDKALKVCYKCQPGEKVDHATASCVPDPNWEPPADTTGEDTPVSPDTTPPSDTMELLDERGGEDRGTDLPTDQPGNPDAVPPGAVGAACAMDKDCADGAVCFDWPGGYCTVLGCTGDAACPDGAACLPLLENGTGCFDRCGGPGECRPGYGCKGVPDAAGGAAGICHPTGTQQLPAGATCTGHGDCAGDLSCVHLGGGLRCVRVGCGLETPCAETEECVWLGWVSACLAACDSTADCADLGDGLVCEEREDLSEKAVDVCTTPSGGLPVGSSCVSAAECQSGVCDLVVVGICSDSGKPCATDQACTMGVCVSNPAAQEGVCTDWCSGTDLCEEGFCVDLGGEAPVCASTCTGWNDPCGAPDMGLSCVFGDPVSPPSPSGKYACVLVKPGLGGTPCEDDLQCATGDCYRPGDGEGFCASPCGVGKGCPFGAICVQKAGASVCMKRCASDFDCAADFTCTTTTYSAKTICVLDEEL
ncbi:MAG: hypothetical protein FJ098_01690 [Deltaproteobacteria bacterium]|nr:hypothetical protein [Deltaproteobacteria bacterium]